MNISKNYNKLWLNALAIRYRYLRIIINKLSPLSNAPKWSYLYYPTFCPAGNTARPGRHPLLQT